MKLLRASLRPVRLELSGRIVGNTPVGSIASIYWPQVAFADVLALVKKLYSTHQLSSSDGHTIECTVTDGVTFVPIPTGDSPDYSPLIYHKA
jgi:hypothetical protein